MLIFLKRCVMTALYNRNAATRAIMRRWKYLHKVYSLLVQEEITTHHQISMYNFCLCSSTLKDRATVSLETLVIVTS